VKRTVEKQRLGETRAVTSERKYLKVRCVYLAGWRRGDVLGLDECCMSMKGGMGETWCANVGAVNEENENVGILMQILLTTTYKCISEKCWCCICMFRHPHALKSNLR